MVRTLGIGALSFVALGIARPALAVPLELSYGGRLTDNVGAALAGPVNLRITFWNHATASAVGNQIFNPMNRLRDAAGALQAVPDTLQGVALSNGVFQLSLYLDAADFHALFPASAVSPWIQVEQVTVGGGLVTSVLQTFPRQKFATVPYAMKVPVDGKSVAYDTNGQLKASSGTLCGMANYNISNGLSVGALCQGLSPSTSCPSGYTQSAVYINGGVDLFYACVAN